MQLPFQRDMPSCNGVESFLTVQTVYSNNPNHMIPRYTFDSLHRMIGQELFLKPAKWF